MNSINNDEILFENLDYGGYIILQKGNASYLENVKFATADFNRLYINKVRLPEGKGNIIYLLTDTFDNAINMVNSHYFITPPSYRRFFYPWVSFGNFMNKRYSMNIRKDIKYRNSVINEKTKLRTVATRTLGKTTENTFFCTADLYSAVKPILQKAPVRRNSKEFFPSFFSILKGMSPEVDPKLQDKNGGSSRVMIIDCDAFSFKTGASLDDNKTNPLFLLYLAYLQSKDLSKLNIDIDMLICSKNMFMKFNPSKLNNPALFATFKRILFKIINANLDDYTDKLSEEEKNQIVDDSKTHTLSSIVNDAIDPYVKDVSQGTKSTLSYAIQNSFQKQVAKISAIDKKIKETKKAVSNSIGIKEPKKEPDLFQKVMNQDKSLIHTNPVTDPLDKKKEKLFNSIGSQYVPLATKSGLVIDDYDDEDYENLENEDYEDEEEQIKSDVNEILSTDEEVLSEVLDEIQDKVAPLNNTKTSPVNSKRDKKLREEQKKVVVKNSTIEEVLSRDINNIPIETVNKSNVLHTSNKNMHDITFINFNKTYLDKKYVKDLVACFDQLKDKDSPFYITNIDIKDSSDNLNYKETWTVSLVDENNKKHTIKVDIPKFQNDRFMLIEGTRWIILNQNFYNPLVKDTPDTVIMTTNFNKVTIRRRATKSISTVERIFSLIKKTGDNQIFISGDSSRGNMQYISSLEYDELSRKIFKFESKGCQIYFSRDYIKDNLSNQIPKDIKGNEFFIGFDGKNPILINEDTGLDRSGRTIADIIENSLPDDYKAIYQSIKSPSQSMYVEGKLAGEFIPIIVTLIVWVGLTKALNKMGIYWKFNPNIRKMPAPSTSRKYIRFADGILEYESKTFAELILNGLSKLHPERLQFSDFDTEVCYNDYIYSQWGSYNGITELKTFYEFLVDPITKTYCEDLFLPTEPDELLIYAAKLLADNSYVSKASDKSYRVRTIEMVPAILYSCIAGQYKAYVKSGRRIPMTLNQKCVIQKLIAEKTVEAYSTLNPVIEVGKMYTISTKGYKGSNSDYSYDEEKRSYDPSSVGKIAISTSADANVGINKSLVVEPTISNVMGYRDQNTDQENLKDVNIFSPVEMLTPGTARNDDPIRTAIAVKQSQHVVPVTDASPSLVSNGYDEAVQFSLSDDFVINAEEDGKVIDVNEELGFIMVEYKSGKKKAIYTKPEIVKNSGGGFYMSNQLKPVHTKVGEKFKKDEPLAYHDKYFKYSEMNGLRYAIGPIAKMAFMSSYNTYEDAGICTESLSDRMASSIVYQELGKFKRNNNIISMVNVGDTVNIGDSLIKFDLSVEDNELAKYLTKLSEENAELLTEETKNDIKTNHAGTVIDIKVYTLLDPSNLSPSLANIVQKYFDHGLNKKKYLEQFDDSEGIMKAGYLLTDSTAPNQNKYNSLKGNKGIDVLIEIYIEHKDVMGVGDKVALYAANKQIISEVIPKDYEPYSEFRPDEEISIITSPGTVARRMTPSVIPVSAAMKCMIELKRKIKEEIKYK